MQEVCETRADARAARPRVTQALEPARLPAAARRTSTVTRCSAVEKVNTSMRSVDMAIATAS